MSDFHQELLRLGNAYPDLQSNIREVFAAIGTPKKAASSKDPAAAMEKAYLEAASKLIADQIKEGKPKVTITEDLAVIEFTVYGDDKGPKGRIMLNTDTRRSEVEIGLVDPADVGSSGRGRRESLGVADMFDSMRLLGRAVLRASDLI
jgi:hypothetical protein